MNVSQLIEKLTYLPKEAEIQRLTIVLIRDPKQSAELKGRRQAISLKVMPLDESASEAPLQPERPQRNLKLATLHGKKII